MAYSKSQTAKKLGISTSELEKRAKQAGFSDTESYATSKGLNQGSSSNYSNDAIGMANEMAQQQTKLVEPAAQALEATATPLKQRYTDLISSIKGEQGIATNRQTVTTNNELAKRGILGDSGVAQQEMTNALNPITQTYSNQIRDTSNQQNVDLSNLASSVASMRAGAATGGFTAGLGQYNTQNQQAISKSALDVQNQQLAAQIAQNQVGNYLGYANLGNANANTNLAKDTYNQNYGTPNTSSISGLSKFLGGN